MAKIQVFHEEGSPFIPAQPEPGAEDQSSPGSTRVRHPGGEAELQLFEVTARPGLNVPVHAHMEDEIVYMIEGELRIGGRTLKPGDSMFIKGMTLYGFDAGPDGARFLNFRGKQDFTNFSRDDFFELKKLGPEERSAMIERNVKERLALVGWD